MENKKIERRCSAATYEVRSEGESRHVVGYASGFDSPSEDMGLPMLPFSQALGNFNKPTKEMERLMLSGRVVLDNNEINRHCFRNVVLARDHNGNIKPSKQFVEKKIDGVIVMLEALGAYMADPCYNALL